MCQIKTNNNNYMYIRGPSHKSVHHFFESKAISPAEIEWFGGHCILIDGLNVFRSFRWLLQIDRSDISEQAWSSHSIVSTGLHIQSARIITTWNLVALQYIGFRFKWQIEALRPAHSNETNINRFGAHWSGQTTQPRSEAITIPWATWKFQLESLLNR